MATIRASQPGTDIAVMPVWQALLRLISGKPDVVPPSPPAIPAGVEETIQSLRASRREADQQTRELRAIARRNDPAAALRLARERRMESGS